MSNESSVIAITCFILPHLLPYRYMLPGKYIVWFGDVGKEDVALVGGKGANLGEMTQAGFPVPEGFILTSKAYYDFIRHNDLQTKINHLLGTIDYTNQKSLEKASKQIKKLIQNGLMPEDMVGEIFGTYAALSGVLKDALVAVRSSATAEDLPDASFAGQQETFLNVKGEANLLLRIKDAWASLFDTRAIFYRHERHFDHFKVGIALPIQRMVESETSGIMFTIDPVTNDKSKIVIEAIYGLGELIVQGEVTPDHYEVNKQSLAITDKTITEQKKMLRKKGLSTGVVKVTNGKQQKITDHQIETLAALGKKLEHHYYFPQDSEWAIAEGKIYLVQTRPITTIKTVDERKSEQSTQTRTWEVLLKGSPASPGIISGPVRIIKHAKDIPKLIHGEILVTPQTNPDFVTAMKKAKAIITEQGGRTSHAAIVSRELGIPAVVGTSNALKVLRDGDIITVNGTTGEIFKGGTSHTTVWVEEEATVSTATKVYVNLAEPELAEKVSKRYVDGIGLLRAEFMMAGIGIHPKKMIRDGKRDEYVQKLAEGIAQFCTCFSPRPVVYRTSDFKSSEYRGLQGGEAFEQKEPNPLLGFRGAFRYLHDPEVFQMELDAIKIVREKMGLKNLWVMLPFVRTVRDLKEVKKLISNTGLYRSASFKLWMMVETPANIILLDKFIAEGIDGVSIGSNDLTMLLLGIDRDNPEVAQEFNEEDDAVLWAIEKVIKTAHKCHITSSLCGQALLTHPNLLDKLVQWGITSVSVSPDALATTRTHIAEIEKRLVSNRQA